MRTFWWPLGRAIYPFHEIIYSAKKEQLHPPETNMEPKHGGWEDDFPFQLGDF